MSLSDEVALTQQERNQKRAWQTPRLSRFSARRYTSNDPAFSYPGDGPSYYNTYYSAYYYYYATS